MHATHQVYEYICVMIVSFEGGSIIMALNGRRYTSYKHVYRPRRYITRKYREQHDAGKMIGACIGCNRAVTQLRSMDVYLLVYIVHKYDR